MNDSRQLILYSGSLCHLCDQAKQIIYSVLPAGVALREINISGDASLEARYALRIPVLAIIDHNGQIVAEKGWPFSCGQVKRLLADNF